MTDPVCVFSESAHEFFKQAGKLLFLSGCEDSEIVLGCGAAGDECGLHRFAARQLSRSSQGNRTPGASSE